MHLEKKQNPFRCTFYADNKKSENLSVMVLFINACARERSRTLSLAQSVLEKLQKNYETLNLYGENVRPLDFDSLTKRQNLIQNAEFSDPVFRFANQFRSAEEIVVAVPYWDLSFPAVFKCYVEAICVNGLTFQYNENGTAQGLCKAKRLIYVTTAGGFIPENNFGYNYVKQLCNEFFGIKNTLCVKAEGLDVWGADVEEILRSAKEKTVL